MRSLNCSSPQRMGQTCKGIQSKWGLNRRRAVSRRPSSSLTVSFRRSRFSLSSEADFSLLFLYKTGTPGCFALSTNTTLSFSSPAFAPFAPPMGDGWCRRGEAPLSLCDNMFPLVQSRVLASLPSSLFPTFERVCFEMALDPWMPTKGWAVPCSFNPELRKLPAWSSTRYNVKQRRCPYLSGMGMRI